MNKRVVIEFTILTFLLMLLGWGACVIFAQFDFTLSSSPWLYVFYVLGGLSPTVASYVALKRNGLVNGFRHWLKNLFTIKAAWQFYLITIALFALKIIPHAIFSSVELAEPFYMLFLFLPLMLVGGGLEEAGWRYALQPQTNKGFGFVFSALIVSGIWALWHLPLFFIPEVAQYKSNFLIFLIGIIGSTFALGAIIKNTSNVFLCILFHTIMNAFGNTFSVKETYLSTSISSVILIIASLMIVFVRRKKRCYQNQH